MKTLDKTCLTDEVLVHLFVETQQSTYFAQLYLRYSEKVYRKCLSVVKNTELAHDFSQDIFLKLMIRMPSYRSSAKFSTWLYAITHNYCVDQIRVVNKNTFHPLEVDETRYPCLLEEDPAEYEYDMPPRLQQSICSLTIEEQHILRMRYWENMSLDQIAKTLNISLSAIKMRISRIKDKLRKQYTKQMVVEI